MLLNQIHPNIVECGTDEAGRGCLCGPVTAAAVILPPDFKSDLLNDSKKLSRKRRYQLRSLIEEHAIAYHVSHVMMETIDKINILNASILAMHQAIDGLQTRPEHIAVDGNRFKPYTDIDATTVIKGDGKYLHIAAASILAKTYRDDYMEKISKEFPEYGWNQNQGYPTKKHREAIREFGTTPYHRMTFKLLPEELKSTL
ncbi:ribonuclease HII [Nonlabens ulvanivorans]|uniref:Ribonuclease HII n=1 Tax=Nonlabens ulvanivorans TaxID=906888 RepID=A0A090QAN1_NONUL|nr:ribonuclease HII [Nonlabens ulvanivorans]GAK99292.1 ribonuclease HII [Nonlabens ulvanivorans]